MTKSSYKQRFVSMDEETRAKLEKIAKANFRTMTGQVKFWVNQAEKGENNVD